MMRKLNRNYSLSAVAPFIAILTLLIAVAALAQVPSAGRPSGNLQALPAQGGADNPERVPMSRFRATGPRPWMADSLDFLPPVTYSSGGLYSFSVAVADLNGDHKPDLVVTNRCTDPACDSDGSVAVLLGNGDGTFQAAVIYDAGGLETQSVAVADVNGDGKPDILVANASDTVGVLLGNGDGTFQPAVTYDSGGAFPESIFIADVNGDGKPDILVANFESNTVGVLLGNGDGTFQPAVTYGSGGPWPGSIFVADVNGDGKPDIVVANNGDITVSVLLGNGDGTFQNAVTYNSGGVYPQSVVVADVNGDGKLDIVVANCSVSWYGCSYWNADGDVGVLLGNGDGTFQAAVAYDSGGMGAWSVAVSDVNGDGRPDLIVANWGSDNVGVLMGGGRGTFAKAITTGVNGAVTSVAVADVNGDGKPDLLVTIYGGVAVLLNNFDIAPRATRTVVNSSGSPSLVGQPVKFTTMARSTRGAIPDGELVTFYDGNTQLGSVALANGRAAYTTSSLSAKAHYIKATYAGDVTFLPSTGGVTQVVDKYPTTTALGSTLNPSNYGQAVTFTATVTSTGPHQPTGTVIFKNGSATLGSKTLNAGGVATLTTAKIPVGTDSLTATYNGDASNAKSVSAAITQTVSQASLSMVLTSTPNPSKFGKSVKFTATLTSNGGLPSGQPVTFSYNGATLGTANVSSTGVVTLSTTTLPQGSDLVTAAYAGTVDYSSASATVTQVVN